MKKISFWDEDRITILSPSKELFEYAHKNENGSDRSPEEILIHSMPYVLLININDIKILLASDSDDKCWEYILKNHGNKIGNISYAFFRDKC